MNALLIARIHNSSIIFSRISNWFIISFGNSLLIFYLFCEFTLNSLSVKRIHFEFIPFLANSVWIHYLFCEFTMDLLIISKKSTNPKYISKNESNIAEQMMNSRKDNISIKNSRNKLRFCEFIVSSLWIGEIYDWFIVNSQKR